MSRDYYAEGYQQAAQDFSTGKGYKPHDMGNLVKLVATNDKNNDAFLKGYRAGYDYCAEKKLQQFARDSMQANPGGGSPSRKSKPSFDPRPPFRDAPDDEPKYR